jgi:hypothetical protein
MCSILQHFIRALQMPRLPRGNLQCHYCGKKSGRKWDVYIVSWKCNYCEAFNYLDEVSLHHYHYQHFFRRPSSEYDANNTLQNGQITDPPVSSASKQASPQYGRYARHTQSPDLSPQGNDIFCKQCVTNQHFVSQNLAEYLPEPSHPEYNKFLKNLENYKKDLETRYPQVCVNCAPRVNARLEATKYAAKADHLRRGLAKKKPLLHTPDWQRWDSRRMLVFIAGTAWWMSALGQAIWHLLGTIPPAEQQMRMRNTSWYGQWTCTASSLASWELQNSCLEATRETAWRSLYLGLLSFWWNPQLSKKLYSQERRLSGVGGHLLIQVLTLSVRALALFVIEHQEWRPAGVPAKGIHSATFIILTFFTIVSLSAVKLTKAPKANLTDHHPVHIDPSATRPAYQTYGSSLASQTNSFSMDFPISALSKAPQAASSSPPDTQLSFEEQENEMDWTPTGPSQYTQFNYQPTPEYRRPDGPNPFRGTLPPAPKAPAHKLRNPKPFLPASQEKKNSFMRDIRGQLRAATGTPSDDEDETFGFGGRKKNSSTGFVLNPSNMRDYKAEGATSGLEDLFNSAFTINSNRPSEQPNGNASLEPNPEDKGYVLDGETVRENVMVMRAVTGLSALLVLFLALAIGMGWFNVKGAIDGVLYEKAIVEEVHEVIEDFVEDYVRP